MLDFGHLRNKLVCPCGVEGPSNVTEDCKGSGIPSGRAGQPAIVSQGLAPTRFGFRQAVVTCKTLVLGIVGPIRPRSPAVQSVQGLPPLYSLTERSFLDTEPGSCVLRPLPMARP